ncbi:hypothetical protein HAX54_037775 [Datura stramonium]|uniref:Uncharacterized protein n=1 Tax=Datura stramonium TaxID=4076 RepID=A0ABS8SHI3_DATST|nr:hypothetical protein [Datura stramonium]
MRVCAALKQMVRKRGLKEVEEESSEGGHGVSPGGPLGLVVRQDEEKRKKREKGEFGGRDLGVGGVRPEQDWMSEGEGEGDGCEVLWVVSSGSGERGRIGEGDDRPSEKK